MFTTPRTMPGVLELLPLEQTAFQKMVETVRRVYELHGFVPIETPVLELTDVLLTKTGGETERQVYFAQSTGSLEQGREPDLALRFDLTVPLARYVAEHQNDLVFPFRRYQIQRVYRGEAPQRGRFREFYQADIDIIGLGELPISADAECPAVIHDVFKELAIGEFTVRINNRKLVQGMLTDLDVQPDSHAAVLREIDKLDKRGAGYVEETLGGFGLSHDAINRLLDFVAHSSPGIEAAIRYLSDLVTPNELMGQGRSELITVFETLRGLGVADGAVVLDCSIARGLDYYTGTVFETILDDHPEIGSICSGGRYDDLAGMYTKTSLPGVGISIGLTRLFWQLSEIGLVSATESTTLAFITLFEESDRKHAAALATSLRGAGVPTLISDAPRRLGKQLKYADRAGIRFAIIAGSDERSKGVVTVKDMIDETQSEVSVEDLPSFFQSRGSR
jgi:histidyl-tRNA synthetase